MAKSKSSANSLDIFGNMQKLNGKTSSEVKNEGLTSSKQVQKFHVTFLNDTEVFKEFDVNEGEEISYPETTPSKASDSMFHYHFKGWDKEISTVMEDTVIHAEYEKEALTFEVKFQLDENIIHTENITYGNLALAPTQPIEKADDEQYHYTFSGWEPALSIPITSPTTFIATFVKSELPKPEPVIEKVPETTPEINTSEVAASQEPETVSYTSTGTEEDILAKETDIFTSSDDSKETVNITAPVKAKVGRPATKKGIAKKVNVLFTEDTMEIINTAKVFFDGNMTKYLETLIMEDYKKNKDLYDTLAKTKRI